MRSEHSAALYLPIRQHWQLLALRSLTFNTPDERHAAQGAATAGVDLLHGPNASVHNEHEFGTTSPLRTLLGTSPAVHIMQGATRFTSMLRDIGSKPKVRRRLMSCDRVAEPTPPDLGGLSSVFFAIHLAGGHIGLPILVATFVFSKTAKRPLTVINFCIIWIFYSIIYCILCVNLPFCSCIPYAHIGRISTVSMAEITFCTIPPSSYV